MCPPPEVTLIAATLFVLLSDLSPRVIDLYSGPQVLIRIGDDGPEFNIAKKLLCTQSPYFAAIFKAGRFKEVSQAVLPGPSRACLPTFVSSA